MFAGNVANVIFGVRYGVETLLNVHYPGVIIILHCINHRLKAAIGDSVKKVHGINPFQ